MTNHTSDHRLFVLVVLLPLLGLAALWGTLRPNTVPAQRAPAAQPGAAPPELPARYYGSLAADVASEGATVQAWAGGAPLAATPLRREGARLVWALDVSAPSGSTVTFTLDGQGTHNALPWRSGVTREVRLELATMDQRLWVPLIQR